MAISFRAGGAPGITGSGSVNNIPVFVGTTRLGNSTMRQVGASIVFGATDPTPTGVEAIRTMFGIDSDTAIGGDSVQLGRGIVTVPNANARNVLVGVLARADASAGGLAANVANNFVAGYNARIVNGGGSWVVIGADSVVQGPGIGAGVLIGPSLVTSLVAGYSGVAVGVGITGLANNGVLIGNQGGSPGDLTVGIGRLTRPQGVGSVTLGDNTRSLYANSIVLGRNTDALQANQLIAGALNLAITEMLIGEGALAAGVAQDFLWRQTGSQGTNANGNTLRIRAGLGTGNATGAGEIIFQTGTPGASGFVGQTPANRLRVRVPASEGRSVDIVAAAVAGAGTPSLSSAPNSNTVQYIPVFANGVAGYMLFLPA